jgi:putative membrane protein
VSPTVSNGRVIAVNPARPDHCGGTAVHLVCDVLVLGGFLVVFLGAAALMVRRQRIWTVSRLHPRIEA